MSLPFGELTLDAPHMADKLTVFHNLIKLTQLLKDQEEILNADKNAQ